MSKEPDALAQSGAAHAVAVAVAALRGQVIDRPHKGLPSDVVGRSVAEVADQCRELFSGGFSGPVLALDRAALVDNADQMAAWCSSRGVELAPHVKTTMAPALFYEQLIRGAAALTVATVGQAAVCRRFGAGELLIANQVSGETELAWIGAELTRSGAGISCFVDSLAGVALADRVLRDCAPGKPLDVLVEHGAVGGRAGSRDPVESLRVARAVAASPVLRLVGVAGYEGAIAHDASSTSIADVDTFLDGVVNLAEAVSRAGLVEADEVVVSAGGSSYFDRVARLRDGWPADQPPIRVLLRSGCYLTHDSGYYARTTPAERGVAGAPELRAALCCWARIGSRPERDLALVGMGKRDVAFDEGLPMPMFRTRGEEPVSTLRGWRCTALNDQHAFLHSGADADPLEVGDWVGFGLSHPCAVFDRWRLIPVVDNRSVVDLVHTFF